MNESALKKFIVHSSRLIVLICVVFLLLTTNYLLPTTFAAAGVNRQINFQGKLVNADGTNVSDGSRTIVFTLYDAASAGTNLWSESQSVTTTDGIFRVALGSVTTFASANVDFNSDSLYLGIKVGADAEMTPRVRFAAVPYALNAEKVSGLTVTNTTGTFTLANSKTLTVNNSLTFAGTDSTAFTFPTTTAGIVHTSNAPSQSFASTQTSGTALTLSDSAALSGALIGEAISLTGSGAQDQTGLKITLSTASGTNQNALVVSDGTNDTAKLSKSGILTLGSSTNTTGQLILASSGVGNTGTTTIQAGAQAATSVIYTLPIAAPGTSGFVLSSTTAGVMSWVANGAGGGISTVRESDSSPSVGSLSTLEFGPATTSSDEFIVTDQTGGVVRVIAGNKMVKTDLSQTLSNKTFSSDINFLDADSTAYVMAGADASTATGAAGNFTLRAGNGGATSGNGGSLVLTGGTKNGASTAGDIIFQTNGSERFRIVQDGTFLFEKGANDVILSVTAPATATRTYTIPDFGGNDSFVALAATQALTNKTYNGLTITANGTNTLNVAAGLSLIVTTANKTLTGAGTQISIANSLDFGSGTTGTITLGSTTNTLSLATTGNTALTLPTSGTVTALGNTTTGSGSIVLATSPTLTTPNIGAATATTVNGLTFTSATDGFTAAGGTTPRTLTVTGADITVGSTIKPTAVGALTVQSNGANNLTLDSTSAGGQLGLGNTNIATVVIGNTANTTGITLNGDTTIAANKLLTFASGTGSQNVTINAGSTGTTANLIVKLDTTGTVITTDTTILNNAIGIALDTKTSGQAVRVATYGVVTAVADNAVTAGDYIGVGTTTAGRAKSLGTTYPSTAGLQVLGRATSSQATPGSTFSMLLEGLDNSVSAGAACSTCVSFATGTADNTTGSNNLIQLQKSGVNKFVVSNNGGLTINGTDNSLVWTTTGSGTGATDFGRNSASVGAGLTNASDQIELNDGTPASDGCSACGTPSTSAEVTSAAIGVGAFAISRPDGKYLIIRGGAGTGMDVYDSQANTFANSAQVLTAAAGTGALGLPRPDGRYLVLHGGATPTNTSTIVDPQGTAATAAGPTPAAGTFGAGTVAYRRYNGRFLVTQAAAATTALYDPVANSWAAGPSMTAGTAAAGALVLPRPDGQALIIQGGSTSTTQLYNPWAGTITGSGPVGTFAAGPSLDGSQAAGTCGINGAGSVAIKRQDGKYVILSKVSVYAVYDPVANTIVCNASGGPGTAMADGAHAIPLQNGHFLIIVGGATTTGIDYNQNGNTFTNHTTAITAGGAGRHSIMRQNGSWKLIAGGGTATSNFDSALVMSATYQTGDESVTSLTPSSAIKWTAQFESPYTGANATANTAFSTVQMIVRTAVNSAGCTTPLNNAVDKEVINSGDSIRAGVGDNCLRVQVKFNRPVPKRIADERGTWMGNGNTVLRLDYATPTLFDLAVDNSSLLRRSGADFAIPNAASPGLGTAPGALTAGAPTSGGSCTAGTHSYKVTFVTSGVESNPGTSSGVITCVLTTGQTVPLSAIPTGPTGTTARKIYRTVATDIGPHLLLTTINDNTTTTFSDTIADGSLGAAFTAGETSGPVMTRVEAQLDRLYLPYGRLTPTTQVGSTGFYQGVFGANHPNISQATNDNGTMVIQRPDKQFLIISNGAANASLYDPSSQTFTAQSGAGNIPTAAIGAGGFTIKRPDGKFLIIVGAATTTNIYDPYAASGSRFIAGPPLLAAAGIGAFAIPNADGTFTIIHAGSTRTTAVTTSSIYDPVKNIMLAGPTIPTVATFGPSCGGWAIPLQGANNNNYKVFIGIPIGDGTAGVAGQTGTLNYDSNAKVFTAGTALASAHGCGSFAFQRQDGWWVSVPAAGGAATLSNYPPDLATTNIINPFNGTAVAGPTLTGCTAGTNCPGRGAHVIPRADGTFLIISAKATTVTTVYFPWDGNNGAGAPIGSAAAGPALINAAGPGALSFQRPDGKWLMIAGGTNAATSVAGAATNIYDAGWYADGQYLSEQINVPSLAANSTLDWKQTPDNFVRFEVRAASSQAALGTTGYTSVGRPGQSIGNAGGETWLQIEANFRRDFPTFGGNLNGVYASSAGMTYGYRTVSLPTVFEYRINNGMDLMTLQDNGLNILRVTSGGNIMASLNGGFFSGGADLAENYTSLEPLEPGDVVVADSRTSQSVKRSSGQYQADILGVVSTSPGFVAGSHTEDSSPIALVGRVPVKVSTENGLIQAGDYLTSSSIPGFAMKAKLAGRVLGQALEDLKLDNTNSCPAQGLGNLTTTKCGEIIVFVNLTNYFGDSVELVTNTFQNAPEILGLQTASLTQSEQPLTSIDNRKQQQILTFLRQLKTERQLSNQPLSEILTDRISATTEVISPQIITDLLVAKKIKADSIEGLEILVSSLKSQESKPVEASGSSKVSTNLGESVASTSASLASLSQQIDSLLGSVNGSKEASPSSNSVDKNTLDLKVLGKLESQGALVVLGPAQFKGQTVFEALVQFISEVIFKGNVSFEGRATFNQDTAGFAKISQGHKSVDILFDKEYQFEPVISANLFIDKLTDEQFRQQVVLGVCSQDSGIDLCQEKLDQKLFEQGIKFVVTKKTKKGFNINLEKEAAEDRVFSWFAISVKDPKEFQSQKN